MGQEQEGTPINQDYMDGLAEGLRWSLDAIEELAKHSEQSRPEATKKIKAAILLAVKRATSGTPTLSQVQGANAEVPLRYLCQGACEGS